MLSKQAGTSSNAGLPGPYGPLGGTVTAVLVEAGPAVGTLDQSVNLSTLREEEDHDRG